MKTFLISILVLTFIGPPDDRDKLIGIWNSKSDSIKKTIVIRRYDDVFNVHVDGPQLKGYSAIGTYENGCLLLTNYPKEPGDTSKTYEKKFTKDSKICFDKTKGTVTYSKMEYKKVK